MKAATMKNTAAALQLFILACVVLTVAGFSSFNFESRKAAHEVQLKALSATQRYAGEIEDGKITRKEVLQGLAVVAAGVTLVPGRSLADGGSEETSEAVADAVEPAIAGKTAKDFEVPYNGKQVPLSKFLGQATLVVNIKIDDPVSLQQMPGLVALTQTLGRKGLRIWCFPTDQGYFEPDENDVIRIKNYQIYGYGQYPISMLFDKIDVVGNTIHPFYKFLCSSLKNPYGIRRVTLNYEKFLLDGEGRVVRRYPRKYPATEMEKDLKPLLAGEPLPEESPAFKKAWVEAKREAATSQYAFKKGLNYYDNGPNSVDSRTTSYS